MKSKGLVTFLHDHPELRVFWRDHDFDMYEVGQVSTMDYHGEEVVVLDEEEGSADLRRALGEEYR